VTFDLTLVTLSISNNLSRFQKDRAIVNALKKMMGFKQNQPTNCTHHLLGAFVAAHPQISVNCQELMIAFPQKSLLLEVKAVVESDCSSLRIDFCWLALENVANSSLSSSALANWVVSLAQDQHEIFACEMPGANSFCQSDGGQKGQEVRLFTSCPSQERDNLPQIATQTFISKA
jgi:hypothetical protein